MKPTSISDLVPGAVYLVSSQDECGRPWRGNATYIKPELTGIYPEGCGEFTCEDGEPGVFRINEIVALVKDAPKPLAYWVRQLLNDLPAKRDWLDPVIEANLRELTK